MAAHPIVIVDDELVDKLPESFRSDPRYQKGAFLELVPVDKKGARSEPEDQLATDWRSLEGIFAGSGLSATDIKRKEREWELAHDERKFGIASPNWRDSDY